MAGMHTGFFSEVGEGGNTTHVLENQGGEGENTTHVLENQGL